jgi:hypothetical protein
MADSVETIRCAFLQIAVLHRRAQDRIEMAAEGLKQ